MAFRGTPISPEDPKNQVVHDERDHSVIAQDRASGSDIEWKQRSVEQVRRPAS